MEEHKKKERADAEPTPTSAEPKELTLTGTAYVLNRVREHLATPLHPMVFYGKPIKRPGR